MEIHNKHFTAEHLSSLVEKLGDTVSNHYLKPSFAFLYTTIILIESDDTHSYCRFIRLDVIMTSSCGPDNELFLIWK